MSNPELTGQPSALDRKAHALVRATQSKPGTHRSASLKLARGLGWFSISLGMVELLAARPLGRLVGMRGLEPLLQACGVREIASGLGILASRQPRPTATWVWSRVAGDAVDMALLGAAAVTPSRGGHPVAALVAVAGVTAVDIACARTLGAQAHAARQNHDYGDRSGLGKVPLPTRAASAQPTSPGSRSIAAPEVAVPVV